MVESLEDFRKTVDQLITKREFSQEILEREKNNLGIVLTEISELEEAQKISQMVAQALQQTAHDKIAGAVTRCLEAVFDNPYKFHIRFDRKRGKTEALLVLSRDGEVYDDPLNQVGGGVIDVASLALRLACVMLSKPLRERLLVLDEPFRNVRGKANKGRLRALLLSLAKDLKFQFILNVDADAYPEFALGSVINLAD